MIEYTFPPDTRLKPQMVTQFSASTASLEKMVWYVMIATVGSFALIVAFFVARGIAKRVKERRRGRSAGL